MSGTNPICFFKMKEIQNCRQSWASQISKLFDAQYRIEAISGKGVMRNSLAVFGKKMPTEFTRVSDNSGPFSYKFQDGYLPDILFICIGHNDFANLKDPSHNNFLSAYKDMLHLILSQQFAFTGHTTKLVNICYLDFLPEVCLLVRKAVEEFRYAYRYIYYL